jgi:hypothetical protein
LLHVSLIRFGLIALFFLSIESTSYSQSNVTPPLGKLVNYRDLTKVEVSGHVVCLHEELHKKHGMNMPTGHKHVYGFKASDNKLYLLLENNLSGAIFQDQRVRDRELILAAWLFPDSNILDVISIKSIKEGKVYDLYYYCVICAIRSATPGPCMCCQDDVEFVEKPLKP